MGLPSAREQETSSSSPPVYALVTVLNFFYHCVSKTTTGTNTRQFRAPFELRFKESKDLWKLLSNLSFVREEGMSNGRRRVGRVFVSESIFTERLASRFVDSSSDRGAVLCVLRCVCHAIAWERRVRNSLRQSRTSE